MKIDKNKLIDLLAEKTDMGRDEIENQLDQLIERILDAAKRGKALEIKEFGLFYFDEEGELSFDPAEELSTEISFKYAGMKPVELKPERDTSIYEPEEAGEEHEDTDDGDPFGNLEDKEDEQTEEASTTVKPVQEDDESINESRHDPFAPEAMEPLEEPVEEEPKTNINDIKPVTSRKPVKKRRDHTGVFILIGIIFISALIGGYFYYIGTQSQELDELAAPAAQTDSNMDQGEKMGSDDLLTTETQNGNEGRSPQNQQITGGNQEAVEQTGSGQVSEEEIGSEPEVSVAETNQPLYGLTGTAVEEANNGYSIVLHSFTSEDRAMVAADRLREDGYRVIVTSRTVYENMVWRVSVGQFETLANAQQATTLLPSPYNTQNFIQRIRTN